MRPILRSDRAVTINVSMEHLYASFLRLLPLGGRILDAGCGPGRDSAAFLKRGFPVVSVDASAEMVKLATELTGQDSTCARLVDLEFDEEFDGIWASGSLPHVRRVDLRAVLKSLTAAPRNEGVFCVFFKHGEGERVVRADTSTTRPRPRWPRLWGPFPV